ncbi:hypothetical protein NADFUDRAFT_83628, partial [Nadsonia fulvescens var. elongata DSM 6958]
MSVPPFSNHDSYNASIAGKASSTRRSRRPISPPPPARVATPLASDPLETNLSDTDSPKSTRRARTRLKFKRGKSAVNLASGAPPTTEGSAPAQNTSTNNSRCGSRSTSQSQTRTRSRSNRRSRNTSKRDDFNLLRDYEDISYLPRASSRHLEDNNPFALDHRSDSDDTTSISSAAESYMDFSNLVHSINNSA